MGWCWWGAVAFQIYDEDGDSKLTTKEMTKLMRAAFAMADNVVFDNRDSVRFRGNV